MLEAKQAGKVHFLAFTDHKDPSVHLRMLELAQKHQFTRRSHLMTRASFRLEIICGAFSDRGAGEYFLFPSAGESLGRLLQIS